jgi:predicted metal-dependent enzyme (double-stranded beta helix superfamily)
MIMPTQALQSFIDDVEVVLAETDDQYEITERLAPRLSALLESGYRLPPEFVRPSPNRHVNYPLYIAPDDRWSLVSVVWNVGQRTPVHGHEMWGVVGIYSGAEREIRYLKPDPDAPAGPLTPAGEHTWRRGEVTVCCTTDDDVHSVVAEGDEPTIGIHVYGGNIGTMSRPSYDPATGEVHRFVSGWDQPDDHQGSGPGEHLAEVR